MPSCGFSHLPLDLKKQQYLLQYLWLAIGSYDKWHCTGSRQYGAATERQSWNTLGHLATTSLKLDKMRHIHIAVI
jgi:hypothetical protein